MLTNYMNNIVNPFSIKMNLNSEENGQYYRYTRESYLRNQDTSN